MMVDAGLQEWTPGLGLHLLAIDLDGHVLGFGHRSHSPITGSMLATMVTTSAIL